MNTMYSLWPQIYKIYISSSFVFSFLFLFLYMKLGLRFKGWQSGLRGVRRSAQRSVLVSLHVQRQVVGAGEAAVAHPALERLGTRVLPVVAGQLVRPRKPPVAALPGALVGLLTRVSPQVSFQMRRLCINFSATGVITVVDASFLQIGVTPPVVSDGLDTR